MVLPDDSASLLDDSACALDRAGRLVSCLSLICLLVLGAGKRDASPSAGTRERHSRAAKAGGSSFPCRPGQSVVKLELCWLCSCVACCVLQLVEAGFKQPFFLRVGVRCSCCRPPPSPHHLSVGCQARASAASTRSVRTMKEAVATARMSSASTMRARSPKAKPVCAVGALCFLLCVAWCGRLWGS